MESLMKKLILALSLFSVACFAVDPYTLVVTHYDGFGNNLNRLVPKPDNDAYLFYNTSTNMISWGAGSSMSMSASQINDSTAIGRELMTASTKADARAAMDAGVSNFSGNYGDLSGAPTNLSSFTNGPGFITSATAPVTSVNGSTGAITVTAAGIGAATSTHTHTASQISDSSSIGRSLLTASNQGSIQSIAGIPTAVSQLPNDSGYITSSSISSKLTSTKYSGSTNGSGVYSVTYGAAYGAKPALVFSVEGGTNKDTSVLTSTTTGFSILVERRTDVLGLLPSYAVVSGLNVNVLVSP